MAAKHHTNRRCSIMDTKKPKASSLKVSFTFNAPDAKEVMVAGDFNNWNYSRTPLRRVDSNLWRRDLNLKPGRYEYKFVVDGNWISDPQNSNRVANSFGTENSIIEL